MQALNFGFPRESDLCTFFPGVQVFDLFLSQGVDSHVHGFELSFFAIELEIKFMYNLQRSTNTPESTLLARNSHILAENIQTNFEAADIRTVAFLFEEARRWNIFVKTESKNHWELKLPKTWRQQHSNRHTTQSVLSKDFQLTGG